MPEGLGYQHKQNRKLLGKKVSLTKVEIWRPQKSGSRKKIDWNLTRKGFWQNIIDGTSKNIWLYVTLLGMFTLR